MSQYRISIYVVKNSLDGQLVKLYNCTDKTGLKSVLSIEGKEAVLPYNISETDFAKECNYKKYDWEHKEDIYLNESSIKALLTL